MYAGSSVSMWPWARRSSRPIPFSAAMQSPTSAPTTANVIETFIPPKIAASTATRFQFWRLQQAMTTGDEFAIESLAVSAALAFLPAGKHPATPAAIDRNHAWYRRRVNRVCELLDADYSRKHSLEELARLAQMSPFHFNRVFRYLVGQPPHQYLLHRRLTAAARDLREGRSVAEAGYGSGFTNLAYFARTFRSRYGFAPSALKSKKVKPALLGVR